jgi:hypothetical protein
MRMPKIITDVAISDYTSLVKHHLFRLDYYCEAFAKEKKGWFMQTAKYKFLRSSCVGYAVALRCVITHEGLDEATISDFHKDLILTQIATAINAIKRAEELLDVKIPAFIRAKGI